MDNLRLACAYRTEDVGDQLLPGESKEERQEIDIDVSQARFWIVSGLADQPGVN
jgi:hypothetical protein